jgi:hypothetical protein
MARVDSFLTMLALMLFLVACSRTGSDSAPYAVVLDYLDEPRGLWLAADGALCVAEAG